MVIPIIKLYCFPHRASQQCILYSQSKYPRSQHHICSFQPQLQSFYCLRLISKLWYILLIAAFVCFHSPSLKLNTIFNLLLYIVKQKRTIGFARPVKAATELFPNQRLNHIIEIIHINNNLQCNYHTPMPHHTQRN